MLYEVITGPAFRLALKHRRYSAELGLHPCGDDNPRPAAVGYDGSLVGQIRPIADR